ncbi:MAG TPA: SRPBCC domain-containing protein [Sphingobacteriaceae bacterium]
MQSIKTEIIINANKERVWEILMDFRNYPTWNPFIISIKGEPKEGSRLTNTLLNGQKTMTFKPLVLKVTPNAYFEWMGSLWFKGLFDGRHYFKIEETGPGQVKLIHGEEFSGLLSSSILKQIGEKTRQNFIKMNGALKQLAEK